MTEKYQPYPMPKEAPPKEHYPEDMKEPPEMEYQPERPVYPPTYPTPYPADNLDLPKGGLKGYLRAYAMDPDRDPNRVLERNYEWYIVCEWGISGTVVPAFGGTWHLTGYAESIGPSEDPTKESEVKLFKETLDVDVVDPAKRRDYKLVITVPASAIPQDGAFKVVVLLNHSNKGKSGKERFSRLAGIIEIPMLQFYTAD